MPDVTDPCAFCRRPQARFYLVEYNRDHQPVLRVWLCSLACLVRWALTSGVERIQRGAQMLLRGVSSKRPK